MIMRRRTMSPAERAKLEFAQAKAAKNEANIEYIAMMTDVELEFDEEVESKKYKIVKKYYDANLWSIEMVRNAVVKNWITEEEFAEITGEEYEAAE